MAEADEVAESVEGKAQRAIAAAEVLLASRQYREAADRLTDRDGWTSRQHVTALVLSALATAGEEADAHLRAAVELAQPLGLRSPFLGRDAELAPMVRRLPDALREFLPSTAAPSSDRAAAPAALVDPLTPRERDLLALLPTHLSNAAMGEQLFLSVNTVKTNLKAVYRKLGASSRADAVDIARRMGLLPVDTARA